MNECSFFVVVDFKVDTGKPLSNGAVAGIVVAACAVFAMLVVLLLRLTGYLGGKEEDENGKKNETYFSCSRNALSHFQDLDCFTFLTLSEELRGLDLQTGSFTLKQIKRATNNFDPENKIGEGGFGPVYKVMMIALGFFVFIFTSFVRLDYKY